ncbi:amidohydrolase family protein [Halobiforma nitratireducens]|uniref:Amidohydrolase 2 n=1 Tax=Halobiforma nitratireducens JCM 10879 TaxID=1227454 RepID=M0LQA5_9EURY|nr:amidohydrolase family protein [Halobiforma nitratireducens]EMA35656.1 amidohydrolase 2 [Halobiforma nitratireducens JCM 10879]
MARSLPSDRSSSSPNLNPGPSRRRFLADTGTASGLALGGAAGTVDARGSSGGSSGTDPGPESAASPDQADDVADLPLIDAHTHLLPTGTLGRDPFSVDELVAWLDDNGVDRAVVHPLESPESYPVQTPSWWVLDEVDAASDRLVPFCTIDPRTLVYEDDFGAVTERLERYVDRGARGFGELKAGLPIDDRQLETLYERCADHELPILFHTDEKAMVDEVGLPNLEDVVASYPEVEFIAHAHAWWAHISADVESDDRGSYPSGPIEPGGRIPELLAEYDNLYGDISARSGWNALARDEEYAQSFLEEHHEQLVFGTDSLSPDQQIPHFDLFERFDLPLEAWADVRYRTLESVLR